MTDSSYTGALRPLMELQSSAWRFMALRICSRVLPIVLYNGEAPWTAPLSLAELIQPVTGLARPELEYVVLDASHYPAEELRPVENVVSGVFLMEQAESLAELDDLLEELEEITDDSGLEEDIALLVSSVVGKLTRTDEKAPRMRTFQEAKNMLLERAERWPKQWEAKGRREGKVELLKGLARHRFGDLPRSAVERFNGADVDTLDRWSRQLLDAGRLEEVFADAAK